MLATYISSRGQDVIIIISVHQNDQGIDSDHKSISNLIRDF